MVAFSGWRGVIFYQLAVSRERRAPARPWGVHHSFSVPTASTWPHSILSPSRHDHQEPGFFETFTDYTQIRDPVALPLFALLAPNLIVAVMGLVLGFLRMLF